MGIHVGDIVVRISYGRDIYFKVVSVDAKASIARIKGLDLRLCADAPLADLEKPGIGQLAAHRAKTIRERLELINKACRRHKRELSRISKTLNADTDYVEIPGKVLHLDGDREYMAMCQRTYSELHLHAVVLYIPEERQPEVVVPLLEEHKPDILVLTGHDGLSRKFMGTDRLEYYHQSKYFIAAVLAARRYQPGKDDLVIFAGACQSYYPGLLNAGANFASAPERVLIHCLDPVLIVEKIAYTPMLKGISIYDVLNESITGPKGIGGIETRGQFRLGLPKINKILDRHG